MSYALNNITAPDAYNDAATLPCPGTRRLTITVRNQAIFYQLGQGWPSSSWGEEKMLLPGTLAGLRVCDGVRFRAAVKLAALPVGSTQATVIIDAGAAGS